MTLNIVLIEPEIPQNTGNISRTCALTGAVLHLVKPLGFKLDDKHLKRAGLDYWDLLEIYYYDSFDEIVEKYPDSDFYFSTTKTNRLYTEPKYKDGSFLVFGKETKGIDEKILNNNKENLITIPMKGNLLRSLNLANAVNIVVFEAFRQLDFPYMDV